MCRHLIRVCLLTVTALVLSPARSEAIVITTRGTAITHVGEVAPPFQEELRQEKGEHVSVGWQYSRFAIYWINTWTWDGQYCLYKGKKAWPITTAEAARYLDRTEANLSPPFLYQFPPGLMILTGVIALGVFAKIVEQRHRRTVQLLAEDPKYQWALQIIADHARREEAIRAARPAGAETSPTPADGGAGFEAAVVHLVNEGVPRADAERNLRQLLAAVPKDQPDEAEATA